MGISYNPKIVTDGLVFAYDMSNIKKSWKGAPTTNLFASNLAATNSTKTLYTSQYAGTYNGWSATGVGNDNPRINLYNSALTVLPSTFYTLSCLYWSSNNTVDDVYLRFTDTGWPEGNVYIQPFTSHSVTRNGSFSITELGDGWKFCIGTFETLSTTTTLAQLFFDVDVPSVEVFVARMQLEANPYASAYSTGTRSNTESLLDLTSNTTITLANLTYNNDNTFSFDGTDDNINLGNQSLLNFGTSAFTLCFLCYRTVLGFQGGSYLNKGLGTSTGFGTRDGALLLHSALGLFATVDLNVTRNAWKYEVLVINQVSSPYILRYTNGILNQINYQETPANLGSISNSNDFVIGLSAAGGVNRYFGGSMPVVQVYNRALTVNEIQQNFNALRGRYGI